MTINRSCECSGNGECSTPCFKDACARCVSSPTGAKLLAVGFWTFLNFLVLVTILTTESKLIKELEQGSPTAYVFFLVIFITGVLFMICAFMDPGYLPDAKAAKDAIRNTGRDSMEYTEDIIAKSEDPGPPPADGDATEGAPSAGTQLDPLKLPHARQEVVEKLWGIDGWEYIKYDPDHKEDHPVRWCSICDLWMSLRSKHCTQCRKCVAKYDHHCIWMGNCVGERTHGIFWWYLLFQSISVIWGLFYIESSITWSGFDHSTWGMIESFTWHNGMKCSSSSSSASVPGSPYAY